MPNTMPTGWADSGKNLRLSLGQDLTPNQIATLDALVANHVAKVPKEAADYVAEWSNVLTTVQRRANILAMLAGVLPPEFK